MTALLTLLTSLTIAQSGAPPDLTPFQVQRDASIIAFVTYKAGLASVWLDNNLTYPSGYELDLRVGDTIEETEFQFNFRTEDLVVNDYSVQQQWFPRLNELGIVEDPFDKTSESRRERIREVMLSDEQLDADRFPWIRAHSRAVRPDPTVTAENAYRIVLDVTIHGETVRADWPAYINRDGGRLIIELRGPLKFSDFGIDPFRRLFGAVRYEDEFYVYAYIVAASKPTTEAVPAAP